MLEGAPLGPALGRRQSSILRLLTPLLEMGFAREAALRALERTNFSGVDRAVDFMLTGAMVDAAVVPEPVQEVKAAAGCAVCLMDLTQEGGAAPVHAAACEHLFHPQCLLSWLEVRICEGNVGKIVCPSCPTVLQTDDVARLVGPQLLAKYRKFKLHGALAVNKQARWCPSKGCETPILGYSYPRLWQSLCTASVKTALVCVSATILGFAADHRPPSLYVTSAVCVLSWLASANKKYGMSFFWRGTRCAQCPVCRTTICFDCLQSCHNDKNCSQTENALLKNWAEGKDTCLCPSCSNMIEKKEGCNHMTCRCGHQFCWLCREPYTANHFILNRGKGCKQFGGGTPTILKVSRATLLRRALIVFVLGVLVLRLCVPIARFAYFHFSSAAFTPLPTCPVLSPFSTKCWTPAHSNTNLFSALRWAAVYATCESALFIYSRLCFRRPGEKRFEPTKYPALLRYLVPLGIPLLYVCRAAFAIPWLVVSVLSVCATIRLAVHVARTPALRASRKRSLRALLVASSLLGVNFFHWPVRLLSLLLSTVVFFMLGNVLTGSAGVLYMMASMKQARMELIVNHHLGGLGIFLAVASNLSVFACVHYLGLSDMIFRLGMFVSAVFCFVTVIKLRVRSAAHFSRMWKIWTGMQLLLCGAAYGSLLFLRDNSASDVLISHLWGSLLTSSIWSHLALPADVLAIAALPTIYNLAHE